jgi:hypothetical protein
MIETKTYQPAITLILRGQSDDRLELSRLLAAAVINPQFCHLLLEDPELALKNGFQGESFLFTEEERDLILSIRTDSLADLANQLARTFNEHLHIRVNLNHPVQPADYFGY